MKEVRSRFAPSPTGYLHLGSARTALFAWAYARHFGGKFILRIEDTDVERSTPAAVKAIFDAMAWLALDYDEGPFFQMQRMDRYRAVIARNARRAGRSIAATCRSKELDALRAEQMARGEKPRYDGRWRPENSAGKTPPPDVKPVLRFRNPDDGVVAWDDGVKGRIEIANAELDDLVIARRTARPPTISASSSTTSTWRSRNVIRGDDHVNNTPRQINIFRALGAEPPAYAHVPTVLGEDGAKLSKRHGAMGVMEYEAQGYLPEALINFLARIGWGHGDEEIFDARAAGAVVRPAGHQRGAVAVQRRQAEMGQPGAHEAPARGRTGPAARAVPRARGTRSGSRPRRRRGGGAAARPRGHAGGDGRCRALFLCRAEGCAGEAGGAGDGGQSPGAAGTARRIRYGGVDAGSADGRAQGARRRATA